MKIIENKWMIMLIVYHFQQSKIIIVIIHAFRNKRKETFDASINDMTFFFFFAVFNLSSLSHIIQAFLFTSSLNFLLQRSITA
jgi:hypothetical protein